MMTRSCTRPSCRWRCHMATARLASGGSVGRHRLSLVLRAKPVKLVAGETWFVAGSEVTHQLFRVSFQFIDQLTAGPDAYPGEMMTSAGRSGILRWFGAG
jgi:hypothetical protein